MSNNISQENNPSTKNSSNQDSEVQATFNRNKNYRVDRALHEGQKKNNEEIFQDVESIEIKLDQASHDKLKELAEALGDSHEKLVRKAIYYVAYYYKNKPYNTSDISLENQIENQFSANKTKLLKNDVKIKKYLEKLKSDLKLSDPSQCVRVGIDLLYKNNCELS